MSLTLHYRIVVTNKKGRVIHKTRWKRSHSYVLQWLQLIRVATKYTNLSIKDKSNTARTVAPTTYILWLNAAAGDENKGQVVGTGTTAPTNSDVALEAQIAHGTGSGQLSYLTQEFVSDPTVVSGNVDYVIQRGFTNGSGTTITINEIGIYTSDGTYYYCVVRDVVSPGVGLANGQTATVQYTLRTSV